jgi:aryl-alcohol dehydrogenase-like predicted oxidoreductase
MLATRTKHDRFISCLCMGTVQLGMPYGIANQSGMPDKAAALGLLTAAMDAGITLFDTAHAYGQSEMRLGLVQDGLAQKHATILTKLSPLDDTAEHSLKPLEAKVEASVRQSLQDLNLPSLPYLLLHRASHLREQDGKIWSLLLDFQKQGLIEKLGVSVATPQEALDALCVPEVECIQLPYNLLDWRWEQAGIPELLARRPDVLVLARSAFLQGLFMLPAAGWPALMRRKAIRLRPSWTSGWWISNGKAALISALPLCAASHGSTRWWWAWKRCSSCRIISPCLTSRRWAGRPASIYAPTCRAWGRIS